MQSKPLAFLAAGAIAALIVAGCSKGSDQSSTTTTTTTSASTAPQAAGSAGTTTSSTTSSSGGSGDAAHGKQIFSANCASCHGATGTEGGVGPSLKNEKSRKDFPAAVAWIKNPQPPMPKLYPGTLNEKDVNDVAAYVESL